jgi:endonuclease-3
VAEPDHAQIARTLAALRAWRAPIGRPRQADPIEELIATILSQNTSDLNSGRAMADLKRAFPRWIDVLAAPDSALAKAIERGGLANVKAARIRATLAAIAERRGELSLEFLRGLPPADARAWLAALPGVGAKTASCVLLFALEMPAMPADTHVARLAIRMALTPGARTPEAVGLALEAGTGPGDLYDLHVLLLGLGRDVCRAKRPRCDACPAASFCPKLGVLEGATAA